MGYPYHGLVPAAILYSKPGLTKEKFVGELERVEFPSIYEFDGGLEGLANILNLDMMRENLPRNLKGGGIFNYNRKWGYHGHILEREIGDDNDFTGKYILYKYNHFVHSHEIGGIIFPFREINLCDVHSVQSMIEYPSAEFEKGGSIADLHNKGISGIKVSRVEDVELDFGAEGQRIKGVPFLVYEESCEVFYSLDDFFGNYSWLRPEERFDFSQKEGELSNFLAPNLRWFMKNGRYYLDDSYARNNLGANRSPGGNWTDLILTAEAVKKRFWKVIEYCGKSHMEELFIRHPSSLVEYEKAIFDSHTSLHAKGKGMTISELLRMRTSMRGNIHIKDKSSLGKHIEGQIDMTKRWNAHNLKIAKKDRERVNEARRESGEKLIRGEIIPRRSWREDYTEEEIARFVDGYMEATSSE